MFDTLLLRPSLHCNTPLHFTTLHATTLHHTSPNYTSLHISTLHFLSFTLHYPFIQLYAFTFHIVIYYMLYAFFQVISRRLNFMFRRFGTLCLFHLLRRVVMKDDQVRKCWSIYKGKGINTPTFSNLVIPHNYPPTKMEHTECSETSAYKIQTPGNYPEESIQHSEQGESLK